MRRKQLTNYLNAARYEHEVGRATGEKNLQAINVGHIFLHAGRDINGIGILNHDAKEQLIADHKEGSHEHTNL